MILLLRWMEERLLNKTRLTVGIILCMFALSGCSFHRPSKIYDTQENLTEVGISEETATKSDTESTEFAEERFDQIRKESSLNLSDKEFGEILVQFGYTKEFNKESGIFEYHSSDNLVMFEMTDSANPALSFNMTVTASSYMDVMKDEKTKKAYLDATKILLSALNEECSDEEILEFMNKAEALNGMDYNVSDHVKAYAQVNRGIYIVFSKDETD